MSTTQKIFQYYTLAAPKLHTDIAHSKLCRLSNHPHCLYLATRAYSPTQPVHPHSLFIHTVCSSVHLYSLFTYAAYILQPSCSPIPSVYPSCLFAHTICSLILPVHPHCLFITCHLFTHIPCSLTPSYPPTPFIHPSCLFIYAIYLFIPHIQPDYLFICITCSSPILPK